MNRRCFLGQVVLGSAFLASAQRASMAATRGGLNVRFVGMMGFVQHADRSMLAALPGHSSMGQVSHAPFLMARKGSPVAAALGLIPMPGVVAGAFDQELADSRPEDFVFRCLDGSDMDIATNGGEVAVDNRADQLAQMDRIVPGKRLRGNLRRWSHTTVSIQGGRLVNAAAHPDAGKVWTFGTHKQRLTDAVNYYAAGGAIRLGVGAEVARFEASEQTAAELWVVSAAPPRTEASDPRRLDHAVIFEYLTDASPVTAYCAEAEGREVETELPCRAPRVASLTGGFAREFPPHSELCFMALFGA